MIDRSAFQGFRDSATEKTNLPRLVIGTIVIAICWLAMTFLVLTGGFYLYTGFGGHAELMDSFVATPTGTLVVFLSFAGIWIGAWIAMRFVHRERLSKLFGVSRRISGTSFVKGLVAVLITSLLSEVALYLISPQLVRTPIAMGTWLIFLLPVAALGFVQCSAEELLFRGYLMRGLAHRFRNPVIWAVLPNLAFTLLHWNGGTQPLMTLCVLLTIGSFAVLLAYIVYATGNLGGSIGAHFGNNIIGFVLISHETNFSAFSLYRGASLEAFNWTWPLMIGVTLLGFVSCALTALLLLHPRSPLRLTQDHAEEPANLEYGSAAI